MHGVGSGTAMLLLPRWLRPAATFAVLAVGLLIGAAEAEARLEGGLSFGSFNGRIFSPQPLADAELGDLDFAAGQLAYAAQPASPGGALAGLFNRPGLTGGFAAGFLGAGLLGMLFGRGMVVGLTGVAPVLGLIFQLALVAMLARLIWTWRRGGKAAGADLSPRQLADAYGRERNEKLPDLGVSATPGPPDEGEPRPRPLNT
jgi:hypothetical protein